MVRTRPACKINQRDVTPKISKGEQLILYLTHCLNLIHTAMKFNYDILKGNLVMGCTKIVIT